MAVGINLGFLFLERGRECKRTGLDEFGLADREGRFITASTVFYLFLLSPISTLDEFSWIRNQAI
jgi:hypothetical protein